MTSSSPSVIDAEQLREVIPHGDPFQLFAQWYEDARGSEPNDADVMALATATPDGVPSLRMVLLKGHGPDGFVFYTNGHSRKGQEIAVNPHVALLFHWKSLRRQIRIEGVLSPVSEAEAEAYFHSRARDSQLGAVASDQSAPLDARATFLARYEEARARFDGGEVERPTHWGGWRVRAHVIEFWHDRPYRLHERRRFDHGPEGWGSTLLYP